MVGEQLTWALEELRQQLLSNSIPDRWRKLAPETGKTLPRWMEQLRVSDNINYRSFKKSHKCFLSNFVQNRDEQYKFWSLSGEPLIMRLAHLHSPKSYITSIVLVCIHLTYLAIFHI